MKKSQDSHLSLDNGGEDGVLVLQFNLQVHEFEFVSGDLKSIISEKHP